MKRVVITGLGAVTPIGNDVATFWRNMVTGVSGAGPLILDGNGDFPVRIACEVKAFEPTAYMGHKVARTTSRSTQFALAAAHQALDDAKLTVGVTVAPEQIGVVMNTGAGGMGETEVETRSFLQRGARGVSPFYIPRSMPSSVSTVLSIQIGAKGPILTSALACASGNYALLQAYHFLQRGEADVMLAGGSESLLTPVLLAGFAQMGPLTRWDGDPARASRPFDADRDGFVVGEGAAVMVLETEEHARQRGASIYAQVLGGSLTGDAHHISAPDPSGDGASRAMSGALNNAGLNPTNVDVIFAHGTGTRLNDAIETKAIKAAFGQHAYQLAVTATKSTIGHTLGAAGAISSLAAVLGLRDSLVPPTINYATPDPDCDLDYTPNVARQHSFRVAMVNAFGFGGQNVALLVGAYEKGA